MTRDPLLARVAAANPVPTGAPPREIEPRRFRPRRAVLALAICAAVAVPGVAFADDIGGLPGLSNHGAPVATSDTPERTTPRSEHAMQELGFPSTLYLLGTREGISFDAAPKPDGHFCFAIGSEAGKSVGCSVGDGGFPSVKEPLLTFPGSGRLAGFAADGVASVVLLDAAGSTLASAPVRDNLFAGGPMPASYATIESRDAQGNVTSQHRAAATCVVISGEPRVFARPPTGAVAGGEPR